MKLPNSYELGSRAKLRYIQFVSTYFHARPVSKNPHRSKKQARVYKTFFMLNSAEHKILNAHKYQNTTKLSIFQAQVSLEC